jgi:hypothetical protein
MPASFGCGYSCALDFLVNWGLFRRVAFFFFSARALTLTFVRRAYSAPEVGTNLEEYRVLSSFFAPEKTRLRIACS